MGGVRKGLLLVAHNRVSLSSAIAPDTFFIMMSLKAFPDDGWYFTCINLCIRSESEIKR